MSDLNEDAAVAAMMTATLRGSVQSITRTTDYESGIIANHANCNGEATRLSVGGDLEMLFDSLGCNNDENKKWLVEQRQRLLNLGKINDVANHHVDQFINTVRNVGDEKFPMVKTESFETILGSRMAKFVDSTAPNKHQREIRTLLGMQDDEEDEEEKELEVIPQGLTQGKSMKCPLTGTFYEDPVKSSVCGHVFSKEAIEGHLKVKSVCPVSGCNNRTMTLGELAVCVATQIGVRKKKRQMDAERQRDLTQDLNEDDEDTDDDEEFP